MSIIVLRNIPVMAKMAEILKKCATAIKGRFELLYIMQGKGKMSRVKRIYLSLSTNLDPQQAVERINRQYPMFQASIPHPDTIPHHLPRTKKKTVSEKVYKRLGVKEELGAPKVLMMTYKEIMIEMQSKYSGLYKLSQKVGHKLLESLSLTIVSRLKQIADSNPQALEGCFQLSKCYRKLHPHFADFQLILSSLHTIQDAEAQPRQQILESELAAVPPQPNVIGNVPFTVVKQTCEKYNGRILRKVTEHIDGLDSEVKDDDSEEEVARKKVRQELKKISPYMNMIVMQVLSKQLVPEKAPFHRVRIYGEPYLPPKEALQPVLRKHRAVHVTRSSRMHNLILFNVPPNMYASLMTLNGSLVSGARLVIRSSDIRLYAPSKSLMKEITGIIGASGQEDALEAYAYDDGNMVTN